MALNPWDFAKSLVGSGTKMEKLLAGSGGWAKGQPLKADGAGGWIGATGASTDAIKFVAQEVVTSGSYGAAIPCTPDAVFRVKKGTGSVVVGVKYGLTATDMTVTTNTTQTQVQTIDVDEADATVFYVVSLGWLS